FMSLRRDHSRSAGNIPEKDRLACQFHRRNPAAIRRKRQIPGVPTKLAAFLSRSDIPELDLFTNSCQNPAVRGKDQESFLTRYDSHRVVSDRVPQPNRLPIRGCQELSVWRVGEGSGLRPVSFE